MIDEVVFRLLKCFPRSFINSHGEVIIHEKANTYFKLSNCKDELEIKCKALEWLSRDSYKTQPFKTKKQNMEFNLFVLSGVNRFLNTNFSENDMCKIYTELGNQVNRKLTIRFIESDYNLELFESEGE